VDRNRAKEGGYDLQVKEADLKPQRSAYPDMMPLVTWYHGGLGHNVHIVLYRIDQNAAEIGAAGKSEK